MNIYNGRVFAINKTGSTSLGGIKGTGISNLVIHITDCTLQFNHNYTMTMEVGEGDRSVLMIGDLSMLNSLVDLHFAFMYTTWEQSKNRIPCSQLHPF